MSAKSAFRSLYRELARQHVEVVRAEGNKDLLKTKTLNEYRQKSGQDPIPLPANPGSILKSIYNSSELKRLFTDGAAGDIDHANHALQFLKNQSQYKVLVDRYNPGLNMDDQERIRLSAKRVGLELPENFKDRIGMK